ncbi:MAG: hypothetical protein IRZ00_09150 [Gemmatimonadetes bacterium]|nr:hypothetical protein [Gemmatimonadota bacterium]
MSPILSVMLQSSSVSIRDILTDLPHDAAAIFIYIFTAASLALVIWGSKKSGGQTGRPPGTDHL